MGPAGPKGADARALVVPDILFEYNKADVRQEESAKIRQVADHVKQNDGVVVRLDGHADPRGTDQYNTSLSGRRVEAVRKALIDAGVPPERIEIAAFGEQRPKCDKATEDCYQADRRVEVFFGAPGTSPTPAATPAASPAGARKTGASR